MAKVKQRIHSDGFEVYVTDSLQGIPQNRYVTSRYSDLAGITEIDKRSGDEIAAQLISEIGLKV